MEFTEIEKLAMLDIVIVNLKEGGEGMLMSEKEYEWMIGTLIEEENYEDCVLLRDNKDKLVGDISGL